MLWTLRKGKQITIVENKDWNGNIFIEKIKIKEICTEYFRELLGKQEANIWLWTFSAEYYTLVSVYTIYLLSLCLIDLDFCPTGYLYLLIQG